MMVPGYPQIPPGQDENCRTLYVGNLDPRVNEYMLHEIFATIGPVISVKIIPDKNYAHGGLNYGFVEYLDHRTADHALQTLNCRKIFGYEIRVNWAFAGTAAGREDTTNHFHIFVGDLSPEVNDQILAKAFAPFGSMSDARVMWDVNTGKSRGYGFVAFRDKTDAEKAINSMNGEWLGSRAIRVNWANQKGNATTATGAAAAPMSYESVVAQTPQFNSTVYVGNLTPYTTQEQLIPLFQQFGYIIEVRMQVDRGFAFVKMDTHENAAMAIVSLQGTIINGRAIKCSWGKDRSSETSSVLTPTPSSFSYPYSYNYGQTTAAAPYAAAGAGNTWNSYASAGYDPYQYYGAYANQQANASQQSGQPAPSSNPPPPAPGY